MTFNIKNTNGIRIKTCHKNAAKIEYSVKQGESVKDTKTIDIGASNEADFPVIVTGLVRGDYTFEFTVKEGTFDLEYILYEI